jgi:hypothetical protein
MKRFTVLAESLYGRAFTCESAQCNAIHIEFGNIALNLGLREFYQLQALIDSLDALYCEHFFAESLWERKLQIQLKPTQTMIAFNRAELDDMRFLLKNTASVLRQPSEHRKSVTVSANTVPRQASSQKFASLKDLTNSFAQSLTLN